VKPAKNVDTCDRPAALVDRETRVAELHAQIRRKDSMATSGMSEKARAAARGRAAVARRELTQVEGAAT